MWMIILQEISHYSLLLLGFKSGERVSRGAENVKKYPDS